MEAPEARLKRSVINRICDSVLPVPSLDQYTSRVLTSVLRERMRDQLVDIELSQSEEAVEMLTAFMVNRQRLAFIKDETNVGLPAAEAASASIAQASMSAFKATTHDVSLATTVNQLSSSLSTVIDRGDQKVVMHFDPSYASDRQNYTLREVADMRSIFVRTTLEDVAPSGKVVIGVLENYDGDKLSAAARQAKKSFQEDSLCLTLKPGRWNRVRALKPGGTGIVCMRLYLDSQLAYSRGISMKMIIQALLSLTAEMNCSIAGSSLQDGIIDILSQEVSRNLLYVVSVLEQTRLSFRGIELSGISSVNSMALERVDIPDLITSAKRASEYRVAQLGMQRLLDESGKDLTWRDLEDESYIITGAEIDLLDPDTLIIGSLDTDALVIYSPDHGGKHASSDQLSELYIWHYLQSIGVQSLDGLWALRLDVIAIKTSCIDLSMIARVLDYCNLPALAWEAAHTSELIEYVYVYSERDPQDVIRKHYDTESYTDYATNAELSDIAKDAVDALITGQSVSIASVGQLLDSMSKYYYAILSVSKKDSSSKEGGPIIEHVAPHAYTEILRFPFVSREKTTCNDWFTMNYVIGADAAKNNYILETVQLFRTCDIKIDPRHLDLISDYVFETGEPAGMGIAPMKRHGIGFTHEMSTQNTYSQLPGGHLRTPEMVESYSISTYMGVPPVGAGTKQREVEQARRLEEMERSRIELKRGRTKLVLPKTGTEARNSDAMDIAVRSMFIDTDPYYSVPTFEISDAIVPGSSELEDVRTPNAGAIVDKIRERGPLDTIVGRLELLREYVGHIKKIIKMSIESNLIDMEALDLFFIEQAAFFT